MFAFFFGSLLDYLHLWLSLISLASVHSWLIYGIIFLSLTDCTLAFFVVFGGHLLIMHFIFGCLHFYVVA